MWPQRETELETGGGLCQHLDTGLGTICDPSGVEAEWRSSTTSSGSKAGQGTPQSPPPGERVALRPHPSSCPPLAGEARHAEADGIDVRRKP